MHTTSLDSPRGLPCRASSAPAVSKPETQVQEIVQGAVDQRVTA
jgi:hypothetical protein